MVSPFGGIIEDCRRMLDDLNTIMLFFIQRFANIVVRTLARKAYSFPDRVFNKSDVPIDIINALNFDVSKLIKFNFAVKKGMYHETEEYKNLLLINTNESSINNTTKFNKHKWVFNK